MRLFSILSFALPITKPTSYPLTHSVGGTERTMVRSVDLFPEEEEVAGRRIEQTHRET